MVTVSEIVNRLARHWVCALPALLVVAALCFGQFERYTPSRDEFFSMGQAGLLLDGGYAPGELIETLWQETPDHTPGFYLLLSAWGNLAGKDIAVLRLPGIFAGLLSLAIGFRLTRDFVAPAAGLAGLLIVAANTHYAFHYDHIKMYSCVVFASGCGLWLYLRLASGRRVKAGPFIAFSLAAAAPISLHLINAFLLLAAISAYHLLCVPKTRQWLAVPLAIALALLCLSPAILAVATAGLESWEALNFSHTVADGVGHARGHALAMLNNQPLLGLLALAGLLRGTKRRALPKHWLIWLLGVAAMMALFGFLQQFGMKHMRYSLSLLMPFALFMTAGLHALRDIRKWLPALILVLYVAAGAAFQQSGDWRQYLAWGRADSLYRLPIHTLSDMAREAAQQPRLYIYTTPGEVFYWLKGLRNYSEKDYFFARHGISAQRISDLETELAYDATTTPAVWIAHQPRHGAPDMAALDALMTERGYRLCGAQALVAGSEALRYGWRALDCAAAAAVVSGETDAITYDFYGARFSDDGDKLYFADRWHGADGAALDGVKMSWQLISADGRKAGQLDLPLVAEGQLRQFAIDLAGVTGELRLMAVVYDAATGERLAWRGQAGMLELAAA